MDNPNDLAQRNNGDQGQGLSPSTDALIGTSGANHPPPAEGPHLILVDKIKHSKFQYRASLSNLDELTASIKENGLIEPIKVRPLGNDEYEVVCGHRRLEAVKQLGHDKILAIVEDLSDEEAAVQGLVENLQRDDLPWKEEAQAYISLIEQLGCSQRQLADYIGKSHRYVQERIKNFEILKRVGKENLNIHLREVPSLLSSSQNLASAEQKGNPADEGYWLNVPVEASLYSALDQAAKGSKKRRNSLVVEAIKTLLQQDGFLEMT